MFALSLLASTVYAQQESPSPITRTVLQKAEFPGNQYATITVMVEIKPGATVPRHTHPGIEMAFVLEGEGDLLADGQPDKHLKAGDSSQMPAAVPHSARNTNAGKPWKLIVTYVVEKDKPLASPAAPK
jgi:quercetin dioxygenase-like cupin family protein